VGVDWVPARPRAGIDAEALRVLVAAQSRLARSWSDVRPDETATPDADERLRAALDIATDADGHWPSFRVAVIGQNPLFPGEWRAGAYRTLLPDQAETAVARWRAWYRRVLTGQVDHYLQRLATWEAGLRLRDAQAALTGLVTEARSRSNAWARTERFREACDRVFGLPAPPTVVAPGPPPGTKDDPVPGQRDQAEALAVHLARLGEATRAYNRSVPAAFRSGYPEPPVHVNEPIRDPWVEEFFAWVEPVVTAGKGLYLWA
jgi:hypothetical protein